MNLKCPCLIFGAFFFLFAPLSCVANTEPDGRAVGGPCSYREYLGQAKIVSVQETAADENSKRPGDKRYEVRFSFHTDQIIEEKYARVEGKEFLLLLKNNSYPGSNFLRKYDILTGRTFPCVMKVITRGTCTPVLFDFPTIDR